MLYYIDKTVADAIQNNTLSENAQWLFIRLAGAFRQGKCYLCGDSESISKLAESLSEPIGSVYYVVNEKHIEHKSVIDAVNTVFVLTYSEDGQDEYLPDFLQGSTKTHFISIEKASQNDWKLYNECYLLCENLTDTRFYILIGEYYCKQRIRGQIDICFHRDGGGGDTTKEKFKECIEVYSAPTLCIIDGDRKHGKTRTYPNEPAVGETLKHVRDIEQQLKEKSKSPPYPTYTPYCLYALPIHEAENLIPTSILQKIDPKDQHSGQKMLNQLCKQGKEEAILYYDFKNGFPYIKEKAKRQYWLEVLLLLGGKETDMPPVENPEKRTEPNEPLFFPPVCKNKLLDKAVDCMEGNSEYLVDSYLSALWDCIGKTILTWGCAAKSISV